MYNRIVVLYTWNLHSIVSQLYYNKIFFLIEAFVFICILLP